MDGQQNVPQQPEEPTWQFKPGETISPRMAEPTPVVSSVSSEPTPTTSPSPVPAPAPSEQPLPTSEPPQEVPLNNATLPPPVQEAMADDGSDVAYWQGDPSESISWSASEYVMHTKTAGWHMLLIAGSLIGAVITWLISKDVLSTLVVVVAGIVLSAYGARKPNQVQYHLDYQGITIGTKHFVFSDFRAFSIVPEGAFSSILLVPSRRFALFATLYYDPADEERIIGILGDHLPHEERGEDVVGSLMRKIRF